MKNQVHTGIYLALLAGAALMPANAQTPSGGQQNNGKEPGISTTQANGATGQRKSGQVVHQDFGKAQAEKPKGGTAIAPEPNAGDSQGPGGNGAQNSKMKVRQEFGPTQANKKNDVVAPAGSNGQGGKPKATDAKTQAPK